MSHLNYKFVIYKTKLEPNLIPWEGIGIRFVLCETSVPFRFARNPGADWISRTSKCTLQQHFFIQKIHFPRVEIDFTNLMDPINVYTVIRYKNLWIIGFIIFHPVNKKCQYLLQPFYHSAGDYLSNYAKIRHVESWQFHTLFSSCVLQIYTRVLEHGIIVITGRFCNHFVLVHRTSSCLCDTPCAE